MPSPVILTQKLRDEYDGLFKTCAIAPTRIAEVDGLATRLIRGRPRYGAVSDVTGVPWHVIAVIHCLEASLKFDCHLHNGDPLSARTVQIPPNRPPSGAPPFTWEISAADALTFERLSGDSDWSLAGTLFRLEKYNGFGYRRLHPEVLTPYLWSFSHGALAARSGSPRPAVSISGLNPARPVPTGIPGRLHQGCAGRW